MSAFVFTGIVGTALYSRRRTLDSSSAAHMSFGLVPAALLGGWANGRARLSS